MRVGEKPSFEFFCLHLGQVCVTVVISMHGHLGAGTADSRAELTFVRLFVRIAYVQVSGIRAISHEALHFSSPPAPSPV